MQFKKRSINQSNHIHTVLSKEEYNKLIEYGNGQLNTGITNLIKLAESKTIEVTIITKVEL